MGIRVKYYFGDVKRLLTIILVVSFWAVNESQAQQLNLDSLWSVWEDERQIDTSRFNAIIEIIWDGYMYSQPDSAFQLAQIAVDFAEERGLTRQTAQAKNSQGATLFHQGDLTGALMYYDTAMIIYNRVGDLQGVAACLNNLANVYNKQGESEKALKYHNESFALTKKTGRKEGMARSLGNIGNIYLGQGKLLQAIENYDESLRLYELNQDKGNAVYSLYSLGVVYMTLGDFDKAMDVCNKALAVSEKVGNLHLAHSILRLIGTLHGKRGNSTEEEEYLMKSLHLSESIGDQFGVARSLSMMGGFYAKNGHFETALDYSKRAMILSSEIGEYQIQTETLNNIGTVYYKLGDNQRAIENCLKALERAEGQGSVSDIEAATKTLSDAYDAIGLPDDALEMFRLHIQMRDSTANLNNQRSILRQEYEQEALVDSLEHAKKEALSLAEIKRKNQQRNAFIAGFILMIGLAGVSFRSYQVKKRDNGIITAQKEEVEHKNEEIMASINYAKKLQTAVLPPARVVRDFFADSFLLYLPRDIVSGDFYWMESHGSVSYFAVADCTGHGVPGAMLSVIGMNGLNRALNEQKLTEPKDILTSLSEHVQRHFEQSESTVRDGMDICLCALDNKTKKLTFSGANNPVWIARAGEMHILKPDRRAIGHHSTDTQFTQQQFQLQDGDTIYLSSDGYQDQLGGSKGHKLMTKVFREKLLVLSAKPLDKQRQTLLADLETWRGNHHQTDDICVMGVRV